MKKHTMNEALKIEIKKQIESFLFDVSPEDQYDVDECLEYMESSIYNVRLNNRVITRFVKYLNKIEVISEENYPKCFLILKKINEDCIFFKIEDNYSKKLIVAQDILINIQNKYNEILNKVLLENIDNKILLDISTVLIHQLNKANYSNMLVFCSTEDSFDACIRCNLKSMAEASNFGRSWLLFEKKEQVEPFYYKLLDVKEYRGNLKIPKLPILY
jgi:hypothetical protein